MHGNGPVLKQEKTIKKNFHEKSAEIIFLVIRILLLVDVIPHTFAINTDTAFVRGTICQTIDEIDISVTKLCTY
jgi:hypothetical protein